MTAQPAAPAGAAPAGTRCSRPGFLRPLSGSGPAFPDPAPASTRLGCGWGHCGLPKVTPPAPGRRAASRARPDFPQRGPGRLPRSPQPPRAASPPALRARGSPPRAPAPLAAAGGGRLASPAALQASLPRAARAPPPTNAARPAAYSPPRGLAASARRPGAGPCPSAAAEKTLRGHGC